MKNCNKCGYELVDEARFCNACGASLEEANTHQPATTNAEAPKTEEELRAEEQALLNKFSIGLKHERMAWKFYGIFFLIANIIIFVCALIIGIGAIAVDDYSGEAAFIYSTMASVYFSLAFTYLPITIVNFVMKKKLETYRAKLYTDCRDGIGHFSVGSIVFCAFFNNVALVFNIVYFIMAKNNAAVIERIKARQADFNSQQ